MVGFLPATILILMTGMINAYTVFLQTRIREKIGSDKVKSFTDLGSECFGKTGFIVFSFTIIINQVLTCTAYCMFFIQQMSFLVKKFMLAYFV